MTEIKKRRFKHNLYASKDHVHVQWVIFDDARDQRNSSIKNLRSKFYYNPNISQNVDCFSQFDRWCSS